MLTRRIYSNKIFRYTEDSKTHTDYAVIAANQVKKGIEEKFLKEQARLKEHDAKAKKLKEFVQFLEKLSKTKYKIGGVVYNGLIKSLHTEAGHPTYDNENKVTTTFKYNYDSKAQNSEQKNKVAQYARNEIKKKMAEMKLDFANPIDYGGLSYKGVKIVFEF